jgi:DNA-binding FrmR family transcriptional regulator
MSLTTRKQLIKRLQRIEGQVRGVQRMVEEDRDCQDILTQLAAIRGAAHQVSVMVATQYALNCLNDPEQHGSPDEAVAKLLQTFGQLPR